MTDIAQVLFVYYVGIATGIFLFIFLKHKWLVGLMHKEMPELNVALDNQAQCADESEHDWKFHSRDGDYHDVEMCSKCSSTRSVKV